MATYAIGDIQGCFKSFKALLKKINFDPSKDTLWIAGDMVNRGPRSLDTLRYLYSIRDNVIAVLGNHDLHLVATALLNNDSGKKDTFDDILNSPDSEQLITWLRHCPLVHHDPNLDFTMSHAGIPPIWNIDQALQYAAEVETVLRSEKPKNFLKNMYGNTPDTWSETLEGTDRLRLITNYFTRMRFCNAKGRLDLKCKLGPKSPPKGFLPWFDHRKRKTKKGHLVFGHWASLEGQTNTKRVYALDTGCVWGGHLSALHLEKRKWYRVRCKD
ncbi:MAG: symmetrical bis(5'-nucleosyl)-tetraphosphatase [Cellvibrionaceae bacterium]